MLGHYQVAELLGAGGMGEVYLAHSPSGRAVAVKVIREDLAAKPGFRERFAREVQAARQVSGAFTAPVLDADTTGPTPWMATQYVEGPTLADVVNDQGTLPADEVWRLASGLCEALRDIHRAGLVHRDLKPGNILLAEDGPRVIDFGISRVVDATALTQSGQILGTPLFMAPEQFRTPRDAGPAADVFALGSVLVHAATGHGPFDADSPYAIAWNAVHEEPNLTGLPESLRPVVEPCLRKDPTERPTPETLLALLSSRRERRTHRSSAREAELARTRRVRLRRGALAAGALACAALAVGVWTWWPSASSDGSPRKPPAMATPPASGATSAPVRMPGWKPWVTQLSPDRGAVSEMTDCHYEVSALWCTGERLLLARLDPRSGKVLWRQTRPGGSGATLLGMTRWTVLAGAHQDTGSTQAYKIQAYDMETGRPRNERSVPGAQECGIAAEIVVCSHGDSISAWTLEGLSPLWTVPSDRVLLPSPKGSPSQNVYVMKKTESGLPTEVAEISQGDGHLIWRKDVPKGTDFATVSGEGFLYFLTYRGGVTKLVRLDPQRGGETTTDLAVPERMLDIVGEVFYSHRGGVISAYDIATGRRLWSSSTLHHRFSAPTVEGDRIHFTTQDGTVIALDRHSGGALWQQRPPQGGSEPGPSGRLTPLIPAPVVLGDIIVAPAYQAWIHSFLAPPTVTAPRSTTPRTAAPSTAAAG
ncbi:protein kinase [Streptomyces gardneri]|uniref:serine/threonine-protein kinase n=1 Tax=Streptomyces gardneri TaxID=66892 RepID=UPI0036736653